MFFVQKTSETSLIDYPSQQQMNDFEKEMCYNSLEDQFTTNNKNSGNLNMFIKLS